MRSVGQSAALASSNSLVQAKHAGCSQDTCRRDSPLRPKYGSAWLVGHTCHSLCLYEWYFFWCCHASSTAFQRDNATSCHSLEFNPHPQPLPQNRGRGDQELGLFSDVERPKTDRFISFPLPWGKGARGMGYIRATTVKRGATGTLVYRGVMRGGCSARNRDYRFSL